MSGQSESSTNALTVAYVDYDKLLADFLRQAEVANNAHWAMGELAATLHDVLHGSPRLKAEFRKQGLTMTSFARQVGLSPRELDALRVTAQAFSGRERHPGLTWEHHLALARLLGDSDKATRRKWLREAGKKHWTVHQLRRQLRPSPPPDCAEERVARLRAQLAEAEAELAARRKGSARSRRSRTGQK